MDKEIKISYTLKTKPVANGKNMCDGCALRIGGSMCMNLSLCPYTEKTPVNWQIISKAKEIED
nr:hypothetical protein [uncultured archaeon]